MSRRPIDLLPEPELTDFERRLLTAGRSVRPSAALVEDVWGRVCGGGNGGGDSGSSGGSVGGQGARSDSPVETMNGGLRWRQRWFERAQALALGGAAGGIIVLGLFFAMGEPTATVTHAAGLKLVNSAGTTANEPIPSVVWRGPTPPSSNATAPSPLGDNASHHSPVAILPTTPVSTPDRPPPDRSGQVVITGALGKPDLGATPVVTRDASAEPTVDSLDAAPAVTIELLPPLSDAQTTGEDAPANNQVRLDVESSSGDTENRSHEQSLRPASTSNGEMTPALARPSAEDEIRLVRAGRVALREGRPVQALAFLGKAREFYPRGVLSEERDTLVIEALVASGNHRAAMALERAFEAAYPRSMHLSRVRLLALEGTDGGPTKQPPMPARESPETAP